MSGPDRIFVIKDGSRDAGGHKQPLVSERDIWASDPHAAEYIRRDPAVLIMLPEIAALIEAAYEKGLSDALGIVASIGYGATEDVDRGHEDAYRAIEKHLADWKASAAAALRAITESKSK